MQRRIACLWWVACACGSPSLDEHASALTLQGEQEVATTQLGKAPGDQYLADVAPTSTGYLVSWFDERYTFGDPSPPPLSATRSTVARLDGAGNVLDPTGIALPITAHALACNDGTTCLAITTFNSRLEAVRIADGALVDSTPLVLASTAGFTSVAVAWNGSAFQVVWNSGTALRTAEVTLAGAIGPGVDLAPSTHVIGGIACERPRCLVTYTLNDNVFGRQVDAATTTVGGEFLIHAGRFYRVEPVWDGARYWVLGETSTGVRAYRVRPDGSILAPSDLVVPAGQPSSIVYDGTNVMVLWELGDAASSTEKLMGARIASDGTVLDPSGVALYAAPLIADERIGCRAGQCLVGVREFPDAADSTRTVRAFRIAGLSRVGPAPIEVSTSPPGGADPAIAFGGGRYLAAWHDSRKAVLPGGHLALQAALFSPTQPPVELPILSNWGGLERCNPEERAVASTSSAAFIVAWRRGCTATQVPVATDYVFARVVNFDGTLVGDNALLVDSAKPSNMTPTVATASDGTDFLVVWDAAGTPGQLFLKKYSAAGALLRDKTSVSTVGFTPSLAFTGASYLVTYLRDGGSNLRDLYALPISRDGIVTGLERAIATTSLREDAHALACGAATCVVAWRAGSQVRASRLAADGTPLDPGGIQVGSATGTVRQTAITFDGQAFVIAWRSASELRQAKLAPNGTVLESNVLVASPPTTPENVAIASDGAGHVTVLYDRFDPTSAFNVRHVRARATSPIGSGTPPDAGVDAAPDAAPALDAPPDASPDAAPDAGTGSDPGISDATNGGTAGFYFLAPLGDPPTTFPGTFDGSLGTRITATVHDVDCAHNGNVGAVVQTFKLGVYPTTQQYKVNFNIASATYISGNCYRVIPRRDGVALGYRDVQALPTGTSFQPLPGYKKWGIGANTTIAVRIETAPASTCATVPDAIAAWTGDNTADDAIGTAEGVFKGTPSFGPGIVGAAAFAFDGTQFVKASSFERTGAFSLSFWAKANAIQAVNTGLVASSDTVVSSADLSNTFQIDWNASGGYRLRAGGSTAPTLSLDIGAASTTQFRHVVVTYDGASTVTVFLDGAQTNTGTWGGAPLAFTAMKIGVNRGESLRYHGTIDDVHVFSRAIAAAEVADIFAKGAGGVCH